MGKYKRGQFVRVNANSFPGSTDADEIDFGLDDLPAGLIEAMREMSALIPPPLIVFLPAEKDYLSEFFDDEE